MPAATPNLLRIDWRQVRRWDIDERELPADASVRFRQPTLWQADRNEVLAIAAVVLLDIRPAREGVFMDGDAVQIQLVLINLLLNAMDAVADRPETRRVVSLTLELQADHAVITVRDHGPGIAAEHLPRLVDSFFSTKHKGMGLGLSIARTIVEAHGGRIRAENAHGEGALFRVELPRREHAQTCAALAT